MKLNFNYLILILLLFSCSPYERLNTKDPLSPYYQTPYVILFSNINVHYTNSTIIDKDTTWRYNMSPIKILQNVLITEGATLTIEPGTEIEFYSIGNTEIGIIVDGALKAIGNKFMPIKFYAKDGALSYIVFRNVSIDSKCELQYCDLSEIYITCIASKPKLYFNKIMDLSLYSGSDLIVSYNTIENLNCYDSSPIIKNNLFPQTTFTRNILIDGNSKLVIYSNNILGGASWSIENLSSNTQYATNNYWGTTNISEKIYDKTENPNSGPVIYFPYFTNEISQSGAGW